MKKTKNEKKRKNKYMAVKRRKCAFGWLQWLTYKKKREKDRKRDFSILGPNGRWSSVRATKGYINYMKGGKNKAPLLADPKY